MKKEKKVFPQDVTEKAINIVDTERTQWEDAVCYVTERVGFKMRELIRVLRKNFWGVFDEPVDPLTGREKIWTHLVMKIVEDYRKNINMGQKDINFRARTKEGYAITDLTRAVVREYLGNMYFGETMDETDIQLCIDGTVVWKTWEGKDGSKSALKRRTVDLLNFYIDPTEENVQSAYRVTERALLLPDQIQGMSGWKDTKRIEGKEGLSKNDPKSGAKQLTTGKFVDVWEMWGKVPKWIVPEEDAFGNQNHEEAFEEVDAQIVVSGLESGDKRVHLIKKNTKKDKLGNIIKPYEELRDTKVSGRWYGLGRAERILALQEWLNTVNNTRINRNVVSQLGLFKIKKGRGITPQMLKKLPSNGGIPVESMDDIEQFNIQGADNTSYQDEEVIKGWAEAITSAYPIASGADVPASQTATTSAIQNTNAKTSYTLTREAKGGFYERWMDRHALPIIAKTVKIGDVVRLSADDEKIKDIIDRVIAVKASEQLDALYAVGTVPPADVVLAEYERCREQLIRRGDLLIDVLRELIAENVDTKVYFTNEDLDTAVTVQNLIALLPMAPEFREHTIKKIYDLLGLDQPKVNRQMMAGAQAAPQPALSGAEMVTAANVPQLNG